MSFKLISQDIKKQPHSFINVVLLGIVAGLVRSSPPVFIKELMKVWETKPFDYEMAFLLPLGIAAVWIVANFLKYIVTTRMRFISEYVSLNLRKRLLDKYLYSSLDFIESSSSGRGGLISRMLNDVGVAQGGIAKIADLIKEPVVFVFTLSYLVYLNWKLTLILFLALPITVYIAARISKSLKKHSRNNQEIMEDVTKTLKESLDGSKIIRSFNLEDRMSNNFSNLIGKYFHSRKKIIKREELSSPLGESFSLLAFAGILILIGLSIAKGEMGVPEFTAFISAVAFCTDAGKKVQNAYVRIQQSLVARTRLEELFSKHDKITSPEKPIPFPADWKSIEFKNITYKVGDTTIIKNMSISIERGSSIALVGLSGSGKTTLVNLLERFIEPTSGEILIGGVNINQFSLAELRDNLALVSQDVFLFDDTIAENIASGASKKVTIEDIKVCAKVANADEFISQFENGYETLVGDSGARLSGGEKQRVSIARAMIKKANILLLDEATSALDTKSEYEVQMGLERLMKGATSVVIAHRLSTIKNVDKIYVLENGSIVQSGSHTELSEQNGIYQSLLSMS